MKKNFLIRYLNAWGIFLFLSTLTFGLIFISTIFINYLKKEEINRIKIYVNASKFLQDDSMSDPRVAELILSIIEDNTSIPVVVTDQFGNPKISRNVPIEIQQDPLKYRNRVEEMSKNYQPIEVKMPTGYSEYVYYDNSVLLTRLEYYPWILGIFISGFIMFSFWFFKTLKRKEEGFLWAGLAKETAHQIGTPLSSMLGWIEMMKLEGYPHKGLQEIEKDVERLKNISNRFSKIGSFPELGDVDLKETLVQNVDYLRSRISSRVSIHLNMPLEPVHVRHSRVLISWVMENLIKNSVDAMKGEGKIDLKLMIRGQRVILLCADNGQGMTSRQVRKAFRPGYSTKKRGWGLGLSLAKRVMKEYHGGDIRIFSTGVGKGTIFQLEFRKKHKHSILS